MTWVKIIVSKVVTNNMEKRETQQLPVTSLRSEDFAMLALRAWLLPLDIEHPTTGIQSSLQCQLA
jgi:hypothetical protein